MLGGGGCGVLRFMVKASVEGPFLRSGLRVSGFGLRVWEVYEALWVPT